VTDERGMEGGREGTDRQTGRERASPESSKRTRSQYMYACMYIYMRL
jgi:hypothetical protein